jgi:murein DD-endopeptidase MepM/ murein hydrolase activator NlpD
LSAALDRLRIPPARKQQFLATAARFVELNRLDPRSGIAVVRDDTGRVERITLRDSPGQFLRMRFDDDAFPTTELIVLPEITSVESISAVVQHSVAQALSDRAHGVQLTAAFADIFQWDVDLLVDPRPGDSIRVVYEVRRLGELPADVAFFEAAANESGETIGLGRVLAASYEGERARAVAFWVADGSAGGNYYDAAGLPLRKSFLKSPLNYRRISSRFTHARRHPITRKVVPHHGVDFAAAAGTPVVSTADGRVSSAGWDGALGRAVKIRHGSEYVTIYGHLRRIARGIRPGVDVRQNQLIGYVGSSGRATGPHLHYSVLYGRRAINPMTMKNPPTEPLDPILRPWLDLAVERWLPRLEQEVQMANRAPDADARPGV